MSELYARQRNPEIPYEWHAILKQDVLRLDVPMNHLLAMGVIERTRHGLGDLQRLFDRKLLLAIQLLA